MLMQNTWIQILLLLAPLFLVPLALWRDPDIRLTLPGRMAGIVAATLLLSAQFFQPGLLAGLLASGWLFFTCFLGFSVPRLWRSGAGRGLYYRSSRSVAILFLIVGAAWAFTDRMGWQPLGFDPMIVLLTAAHFHYAGFVVNWVTAEAVAQQPNIGIRHLLWCTILGVPLTAFGITTSQWGWSSWPEVSGVIIMALGGAATALFHIHLAHTVTTRWAIRGLWLLGGICLLSGMVLAVSYGLRYYFPWSALSIPEMYKLHGTLNSIGFALPVLLGWYYHLYSSSASPNQQPQAE